MVILLLHPPKVWDYRPLLPQLALEWISTLKPTLHGISAPNPVFPPSWSWREWAISWKPKVRKEMKWLSHISEPELWSPPLSAWWLLTRKAGLKQQMRLCVENPCLLSSQSLNIHEEMEALVSAFCLSDRQI